MLKKTVMKTKTLFILNGLVGTFSGLGYVFMPELQMEMYGVQSSESGMLFMQTAGAAHVGFALLCFAVMNITDSASTKMVSIGMMGAWITTTAISLYGVLTGGLNSFGWSGVVIGLFFVVMYGMKKFKDKNVSTL